MEIQSIQSISTSQKLEPVILASKPMESATTNTSWKKFTSETTTYRYDGDTDLVQFYDQFQRDWNARRLDQVIKHIDVMLDHHLPAINSLIRATLITYKSKCYEEMGQMDLALIEAEKAAAEIASHETTIGQFFGDLEGGFDPQNFVMIRKAGLLLHNGRKEEAFAILRENQPKTIAGVLVYHLLDKECKISLLEPKPARDDNDLMDLFLAGRYDEVIEKTNCITQAVNLFYTDVSPIRLRAAALAMAGRTDEALAFYRDMKSHCSFVGDGEVYGLIQALNGGSTCPAFDVEIEAEFEAGFPISLFMNYLLNQ